MTWVKIDDGWPLNPKVEGLSKDAKLLYVCGLCYCGRNLTDGVLTAKAVRSVLNDADAKRRHVVELHEAGLWDRIADGYLVHDYLEYNPTREKVMQERAKAKQRMQRLRSGEHTAEQTGERSVARSRSPSRPVKDLTPLAFTIPAAAG